MAPAGPAVPYASFGARLVARIIDGLIIGLPFVVGFVVLLAVLPKENRLCTINGELSVCRGPTGPSIAILVLFGLAWFALTLWYFIGRIGTRGATIGQDAMKIKVVDVVGGDVIGVGRATGRYFMSIVSGWPCYLGYLWMLWDPRSQTWQDKVANSVVVKRQP
jgi:uncharacterized RDD family membrane protein YckC